MAVKRDNTAVLKWVTASEYNTQDYVIQHNVAGNWQSLGTVKAAGNSAIPLRYTYTHASPQNGHNHYRLVQRDRDGNQTFSDIATVWMGEGSAGISVFPNPLHDHILKVSVAEPMQITLFDATGRRVLSQKLKEGAHTLDVSGMTGGLYHLQSGNEVIPIIIP